MESQLKYNTSVYMWGDIKECIESLGVKIPAHLESKDDDDPIQFVVYPGRSKEVKTQTTLHLTFPQTLLNHVTVASRL